MPTPAKPDEKLQRLAIQNEGYNSKDREKVPRRGVPPRHIHERLCNALAAASAPLLPLVTRACMVCRDNDILSLKGQSCALAAPIKLRIGYVLARRGRVKRYF